MVLQRAPQQAIIWGFADTSDTPITLTMNDKIYRTTSTSSSSVHLLDQVIWSVTLDPQTDEGPFQLTVTQPLPNGTVASITLNDVLFGDVWVCSGQSNMQLTVGMIYNGSEEIANASNYPKIRVFTAALNGSATPVEELLRIELKWSVASSYSIGGPQWDWMSAVCWLYGRQIHEALGGRPIGLIATSYGGTRIEYWMPPKALHDCNVST
jgi:sialate O-acetylesterase